MSRANAQVKFPDGTIKYGIYNGTVDVYWTPLFDTAEEAWAAWREYYKPDNFDSAGWEHPEDTEEFEVEIADDYGGGNTYKSQATKHRITGNRDTDDLENIHSGLPDWWEK